jgi:hypothetical protein
MRTCSNISIEDIADRVILSFLQVEPSVVTRGDVGRVGVQRAWAL